MSDNKYFIILTALGRAMVAESIRTGEDINLKMVAVGDSDYVPTGGQTALMSERARVEITDIIRDADNPAWLRISAIIAPDVGGWHIHEVGIFAENGNLFAVGKMDGSYKPVYTDGMCKEVQLDLILEVGDDANINLVIDPHAIIATRKWVIDYLGQWKDLWNNHLKDFNNPHKTTIELIPGLRDELNKFIKSDVSTWNNTFVINLMKKIRVPVWLERDTDWYVDGLNGSDQNDGLTPATAFKTIQYAVNYVSENFNLGVFQARIILAEGEYVEDVIIPGYQASTGQMYIVGAGSSSLVKGAFYLGEGNGVWNFQSLRVTYDGRISPLSSVYFAFRVSQGAKATLTSVTVNLLDAARIRRAVAAVGGNVVIYGGCLINGTSGEYFLNATQGGSLGIFGNVVINGSASIATAYATNNGSIILDPAVLGTVPKITGTVTGSRAAASGNGIINTAGSGGSAAFPGTASPAPTSGGQIF